MTSKELLKRLKDLHTYETIRFDYGGTKFIIRDCEIDRGYSIEVINIIGWDCDCYETAQEVVEFIFGKED